MISLIICARSSELDGALVENIKATIGVPYELVVVDNSQNRYSIFEAYNEGVKRSRFEFLCFMHDDIIYHTSGWGKIACSNLEDQSTGLVGIAGGKYIPFMPSTWAVDGYYEQNIIHSDREGNNVSHDSIILSKGNRTEVVAVDGVWFCIRKELFSKIRFDSDTFKGFHFYDMDLSLQVFLAGYKVYCLFDILIQHKSKGNINSNWFENAFIFHEKWKRHLPLSLVNLDAHQEYKLEVDVLNRLIWKLRHAGKQEKYIHKVALKLLFGYRPGYKFFKTPFYMVRFMGRILAS